MRVLVASSADNAAGTVRGEWVLPNPLVCPAGEDQDCECSTIFWGLSSGKSTHVATVANLPVDTPALAAAIEQWAQRVNWPLNRDAAIAAAELVLGEASAWAVGTKLRLNADGCVPL
jgi:hypothetical protein